MGSPSQQSEQRSPGSTRMQWNHQWDPPEHLQMEKAQDLPKERTRHQNLTLEHTSGTGSAAQPVGSSKNTIVCSACGESGHWSKNHPYYNFCDVCMVTTHSTHMCRASKHGNATAGSPVCIYCGKTNHGSAYCRYRLKDNQEEPRTDMLRTGTTGKNFGISSQKSNWTHPSQY